MNRKFEKKFYRKSRSLYLPIDLVVCEGETEVDYLKEYAKNLRVRVDIIKSKGSDPENVVKTAEKVSKSDEFEKIMCVFDRDLHANFENALKLSKKNGFLSIVSNPCLEVWFFLHFNSRLAAFGGPKQVLRMLRKTPEFAKYDKDGIKAYNATRLLCKTAINNAKNLAKSQKKPYQDPSTNMHELIDRFHVLKNKQAI